MIGNFLLYDENYQLKNRKNKYTYQRKNICFHIFIFMLDERVRIIIILTLFYLATLLIIKYYSLILNFY